MIMQPGKFIKTWYIQKQNLRCCYLSDHSLETIYFLKRFTGSESSESEVSADRFARREQK